MTINEIQDQIIEEFSELDDWMDKYQLLIDLGSEQEPLAEEYKTDSLGVEVTAEQNREYSYTDKQAGYWYGTTHQESPQWWSGWNMAKKRILADYTIGINDEFGQSGKPAHLLEEYGLTGKQIAEKIMNA